MTNKRKLSAVAVDTARDYFREHLEKLKKLDLDKDGRKDVDQLKNAVNKVSEKLKVAIDSTDFKKLEAGIDQVKSGANMISAAVNTESAKEALAEVKVGLKHAGNLLQRGVSEVKRKGKSL